MQHHITAGCYLVRKKEGKWQLFMIYKKWAKGNEGWVHAKGHVEEGESLEETAIRETIEETGYEHIEIIEKLKKLDIEYEEDDGLIHTKEIHFFLARLTDDSRDELKISEGEKRVTMGMRWFDLDEAERVMKFADERGLVGVVRERLERVSF